MPDAHVLLGGDAGEVVAEAAQQAAVALATQVVKADALLLAVDLFTGPMRIITVVLTHCNDSASSGRPRAVERRRKACSRTSTMRARSWLYLQDSPRIHTPLVKSKQICVFGSPACAAGSANGSGCTIGTKDVATAAPDCRFSLPSSILVRELQDQGIRTSDWRWLQGMRWPALGLVCP